MKKKSSIILISLPVLLLILMIIIGLLSYIYFWQQSKIPDLTEYYQSLYQACDNDYASEDLSLGCCILSVDIMKDNSYLLANNEKECPEEYEPQLIGCLGSYTWCGKIFIPKK